MQDGGPRGAPVPGRSHGDAGRARETRSGERGLPKSGCGSGYNSGPPRPGAGEGNRGKERACRARAVSLQGPLQFAF